MVSECFTEEIVLSIGFFPVVKDVPIKKDEIFTIIFYNFDSR